MNVPERDNFNDLPILGELRDALEARFGASRRRRRLGDPATVIAICVAVAVAAVALLAFRSGRNANHAPARPVHHAAPLPPPPSRHELSYIAQAQRTTIAHDRGCATPVNRGKTFIHGSPEPALLAALGVLRRPAAPADHTAQTLFRNGFDIGAGVYIDYIRRARTAYGKSFYLIPEARTTPFGAIPNRCYSEMRTALQRELRRIPEPERARTLRYQAEQFAIQRHQARNPAGICFAAVTVGYTRRSPGGVDMGCGTTVPSARNLTTGWVGEDHPHGGALIAGMVPDGVGSVTLHYDAGHGDPARTITSKAVNNVVVLEVPPHTAHQDTASEFIVRAPDGRVIETPRTGYP